MGSLPPIPQLRPFQNVDPLEQVGKALSIRDLQQRGQLQQQAIQEGQMKLRQTQVLNDAFKNAITVGPDGQPTTDKNRVFQSVANAGQGSLLPELDKHFTELDKLHGEVRETQDKHVTAAQDYMGSIMAGIKKSGYNPAYTAAMLAKATQDGYGQQAQQVLQAINQNPDQLQQIVEEGLAQSPGQRKLQAEEAQAKARQQQADKPTEASLASQAVGGDPTKALELLKGDKGPTEASLALKAAQGDKSAEAALKRLDQSRLASRPVNVNASTGRLDKSYQFSSTQLDKVGQPVEAAVQRLGRLKDTLDQNSPQADALVAPELLSVMAGGAGSGLRMNEAEISRIVGGRSEWESLRASAQKWSTNPETANSITPDQRKQIRALVDVVNGKLLAKQQLLDNARQQLIDAPDVISHHKIVTAARSGLTKVDMQQGGFTSPQPSTQSTRPPLTAFEQK